MEQPFPGDHDHPRSLIRLITDSPDYRQRCAKTLALMLSTLCGTLFVYQGQEIGMIHLPTEWGIEEYLDVFSKNQYTAYVHMSAHRNRRLAKHRKLEKLKRETGQTNPDVSRIMDDIRRTARDSARLPMQWDASPNGGFSTGKPWMRASPDSQVSNVEK